MNSVFSRSTQPDRQTWLTLAESCEMATKPDKWIDETILKLLGYDFDAVADYHWAWLDRDGGIVAASIPLTASLDQITALIERELPDCHWRIQGGCKKTGWTQMSGDPRAYIKTKAKAKVYQIDFDGGAATPALALCAAFCRAMAEKAST